MRFDQALFAHPTQLSNSAAHRVTTPAPSAARCFGLSPSSSPFDFAYSCLNMPPDNSKALKRKPPACDRCKVSSMVQHGAGDPASPSQASNADSRLPTVQASTVSPRASWSILPTLHRERSTVSKAPALSNAPQISSSPQRRTERQSSIVLTADHCRCTTTPVVRRRPVRKPKAADNSASGSPDGLSALATPYLPAASGSASTESSQAGSPLALLSTWTDSLSIEELPRELIVDLFNCTSLCHGKAVAFIRR